MTHAQTPKRKADDETVKKKVGGAGIPMHVGGSFGSKGHGHMSVPRRQIKAKYRKRGHKVQEVSLDTNKRELQELARNSAEYYFRDKQVEASDALIDEDGAYCRLLTESGNAQIIETFPPDRFAAKAGDLGLRRVLPFIDLCENKPYGPHEREFWDFNKNRDVNELFEMIAFE